VPTEERFDEALGKLQAIVEKLEDGKLSLEESLSAFEEGVRLANVGTTILDTAEQRVEMLTRGARGEDKTRPFEPEGD
jgi:exodeoxyribonuclease VII small subunit